MASALHICRICLSVNVKMITFKNTNMENVYQLLTEVYVDIDDGKPATVCFLCCARLQQCYRLQQQALKSNELLKQLLRGGIMQATANAIINNQCTSQHLQVSTMYHLDLEPSTCKDVLLEPKVESWHDNLASVKDETEAIDEERKNVHLVLDFSEDGYDPYGYFTKALHSDSKEDKQITAIASNHSDGFKDIGCSLGQRKQKEEDFSEDGYDPYYIASIPKHSDSQEDQPLIANGSKICDGSKDTTSGLERSKDQEKENQYKVQSEKEIKNDPLLISSNRRVDIIETEVNQNSSLPDMYCCDICTFKTYNKHSMETHLKIHTNSKVVSYNVFQYRCARTCNLNKQTGEKPFACNICEFKCAHNSNLKIHMRIHTGEKPFSCNICEHRCTTKFVLKKHMQKHTGEKPFSCYICEYSCTTKFDLNKHMKKHTGEKPYSCNICEHRCARKDDLQRHKRTHTGEKPFSCNICEHKFICKSDLKIHMRTHTGEKPFSCNFCEYRCAHKSYLKNHIRTHTGEKSFSCIVCKQRCARKCDLKTHMRTHTDEKPFSCNICEFKCNKKSSLNRHLGTHK